MLELTSSPLQIPAASVVVLSIVVLVVIALISAGANFRRNRRKRY